MPSLIQVQYQTSAQFFGCRRSNKVASVSQRQFTMFMKHRDFIVAATLFHSLQTGIVLAVQLGWI